MSSPDQILKKHPATDPSKNDENMAHFECMSNKMKGGDGFNDAHTKCTAEKKPFYGEKNKKCT